MLAGIIIFCLLNSEIIQYINNGKIYNIESTY